MIYLPLADLSTTGFQTVLLEPLSSVSDNKMKPTVRGSKFASRSFLHSRKERLFRDLQTEKRSKKSLKYVSSDTFSSHYILCNP